MKNDWQNNRISKKLNLEFPTYFSLCDIDGAVRCEPSQYNDIDKTRLIIYESKNENEKPMKEQQHTTLKIIQGSIDWSRFDSESGVFVMKIIDLEKNIIWYDLQGTEVRITNFNELYDVFRGKTI
jgi:hypothetical protein